MPAHQPVISLVYSLIDSIWLAAGLWLCYRFIDWLLPLRPIHAYRLTSFLVTTLFLGWLAIFILYLAGGNFVSSVAFNQLPSTARFALPHSWMNVLAGFYILGFSFYLMKFLYGNFRLKQLLNETVPLTGEWKSIVDGLTANISRQSTIRVFLSHRINSPLTFGWLRPVILFPIASVNGLNIMQFESILLHEIAHIRRNDFLFCRILALMEITLFFNPFSRDLFRTIRLLREECCDDAVLEAGTLPLQYITALSWCARQGIPSGGTLGAVGKEQELLNRILRITGGTQVKGAPRTYIFWMAFIGMVMALQFSNLFPPTPSRKVVPLYVSERTNSPMAKRPQENRLFTATASQPKKDKQQSFVKKKVSNRIEEKKVQNTATASVGVPDIIQTVGWQEGNDWISMQQAWKQIRQLSREEMSQLMNEALQEFNMQDKIIWARLMRNKVFDHEMRDYSIDSSLVIVPNQALAERESSSEAIRVQSKLMLLIWMKWREKYPTIMGQLIHKYSRDSVKVVLMTEQ